MVVSVFIYQRRVSTITTAASLTVNNCLSIKANRGSTIQVIQNVKSVSESRSCTLSPAGATIARNVLILVPGHVVTTVHISPINILWQNVNWKTVPRTLGLVDWTICELGLRDTATLRLVQEVLVCSSRNVLRLWPFINSLVIFRIILFSLSCYMLDGVSPCVGRHTKLAITLNVNVVDSTNDSKEPIFTPVGSP